MKKKKILFVMESLRIGGAEKSLLTILNLLDYSKYDVDLFLFTHTGEFIDMIPKEVNLLSEEKSYRVFYNNRKKSPIIFLKSGKFRQAYHTTKWLINVAFSKMMHKKLYIGWNDIRFFFKKLPKEYDTSIAFLERKTIYFNIDNVNAKNKIGFIHNDYSVYPYDDKLDRKYFKYYNHIATVSDHCKDVLVSIFPEYKDKFLIIKNMVSKDLILKLSKEPIKNYNIDRNYINIVSVGRLVKQKGFDIAIEICKQLIENKINIRWYIVGEGQERKNLEEKIRDYHLENKFILVGSDTNPYKWMKMADIYVQPSRFEGYGITVAEAKCLNKTIIASDIPEFEELLKSKKNLCSNIDEYVSKIKILIIKKDKEEALADNKYTIKNEELKKLTNIL